MKKKFISKLMFRILMMLTGLAVTACSSDEPGKQENSDEQECGGVLDFRFDDSQYFENYFFAKDSDGNLIDKKTAIALDPADPMKLYIGAFSAHEAKSLFLSWIVPGSEEKINIKADGTILYWPTNWDGTQQGTIKYEPNDDGWQFGVVTVSSDSPIKSFKEIHIIRHEGFPDNSIDYGDIIVEANEFGAKAWHKNPRDWPEGEWRGIVISRANQHQVGRVLFVLPITYAGYSRMADLSPHLYDIQYIHYWCGESKDLIVARFKEQGIEFDWDTTEFWTCDTYFGKVFTRRYATTITGKSDWYNIKQKNPKKNILFIRQYSAPNYPDYEY